jgi:hypothetical protein
MEEDLSKYLPGSFEYLIHEALIESFQIKYNLKTEKTSGKLKELLSFY